MNKEFERKQDDAESIWNEQEALRYWVDLCGPAQMDTYLLGFLRNEIRLQNVDAVRKWQKMLANLIAFLLRHGTPMERLEPRLKYSDETYHARNAEEALLAMLNACALVTKELSSVSWPTHTSAGAWLSRLQGQRAGPENPVAFQCLSLLSLNGCKLYIRDLLEANLEKASLRGALASFVSLRHAKLTDACLAEAHLFGADLAEAVLHNADLEGAKLPQARLQQASLRRANLQKANLEGADLEGADLKGANLEGADLEGANLRRADLERASLEKANLKGANLKKANLKGANLKGIRGIRKPALEKLKARSR